MPSPHEIPPMPWSPPWLTDINIVAWILSNILIGYIAVVLVIFVVGYFVLFDPRATTGGRLIFRFALSLILVLGLVFISVFVDPHANQQWYDYPGDVVWWRPLVRFAGYAYVAYTITALSIFLGKRKWAPHTLVTKPDERTLVRERKPIHKQKKSKPAPRGIPPRRH